MALTLEQYEALGPLIKDRDKLANQIEAETQKFHESIRDKTNRLDELTAEIDRALGLARSSSSRAQTGRTRMKIDYDDLVAAVPASGWVKAGDIAKITEVSGGSLSNALRKLADEGRIVKRGEKRGTEYQRA